MAQKAAPFCGMIKETLSAGNDTLVRELICYDTAACSKGQDIFWSLEIFNMSLFSGKTRSLGRFLLKNGLRLRRKKNENKHGAGKNVGPDQGPSLGRGGSGPSAGALPA
jgi:hypothetical protein